MKAYSKVITLKDDLTSEQVLCKLRDVLDNQFDATEYVGNVSFVGRVKTKLMNPVVTMCGTMNAETNDGRAKVSLSVDNKLNMWFWFTLLLCFMVPFVFVILIWMFISQKNAGYEQFDSVLAKLEDDIGSF